MGHAHVCIIILNRKSKMQMPYLWISLGCPPFYIFPISFDDWLSSAPKYIVWKSRSAKQYELLVY